MSTLKKPKRSEIKENPTMLSAQKRPRMHSDYGIASKTSRLPSERTPLEDIKSCNCLNRKSGSTQTEIKRSVSNINTKKDLKPATNIYSRRLLTKPIAKNDNDIKKSVRHSTSSIQSTSKVSSRLLTQLKSSDKKTPILNKPIKKTPQPDGSKSSRIDKVTRRIFSSTRNDISTDTQKTIKRSATTITKRTTIHNVSYVVDDVKIPKIAIRCVKDKVVARRSTLQSDSDSDFVFVADDDVFASDNDNEIIDETIIADDTCEAILAGDIAGQTKRYENGVKSLIKSIDCDEEEQRTRRIREEVNKHKIEQPEPLFSRKISRIQPNVYTTKSTLILEDPKSKELPRKKKTLTSRFLESKKRDDNTPYTLEDYTPEYMDIIINHLMTLDRLHILKPDFLEMYNPDVKSRSLILNWIIKVQEQLYLSPDVYFVVVRLFDHFLANMCIPKNMYQLLAITISWVVTKFSNPRIVRINELLRLCGNAYSKDDLIKMELNILTAFNFKLNINEPSNFVQYYLLHMQVPIKHQVNYCVYYILEAFTLSHHFSTIQPSKLAAAAIYLTMKTYYPNVNVYETINHRFGYYKPEELRDAQDLMIHQLHLLHDYQYKMREPFEKYSKDEYKKASVIFMQMFVKQIMS